MIIVRLLLIFTISGLFFSCTDFIYTNPDIKVAYQPQAGFSGLADDSDWSAIPAPADGLQVVVDPVLVPEPQFLSLQLP